MSINSLAHREDILKAAITEFGQSGYQAASTNEIVKNAKVSKGLLFHHFKNKEKLYEECQLYVLEQYASYMVDRIDFSSSDIFDRILQSLHIKMEFGKQNPELLTLINRVLYAEEKEKNILRKALSEAQTLQRMNKKMAGLFENLDTSKFREGMDILKVMDYTSLTLEASWARYYQKYHNDPEAMAAQMENYLIEAEDIISVLKNGIYK